MHSFIHYRATIFLVIFVECNLSSENKSSFFYGRQGHHNASHHITSQRIVFSFH